MTNSISNIADDFEAQEELLKREGLEFPDVTSEVEADCDFNNGDYVLTDYETKVFDIEERYYARGKDCFAHAGAKKSAKEVNDVSKIRSTHLAKKLLAKLQANDDEDDETAVVDSVAALKLAIIAYSRKLRNNTAPAPVSSGAHFGEPVTRRKRTPRRDEAMWNAALTPEQARQRNEQKYEKELRTAIAASKAHTHESGLSLQQILDMSNRDLTPEDYELLLLLDQSVAKKTVEADKVAELPESRIDVIDLEICDGVVTKSRCNVCLMDYALGEAVKSLPCGHFFHSDCIGPWLRQHSQACPLCNAKIV